MNTPYTYLIGWSKLQIFYYGVRHSKNCSPDDLWVSYFTSSKYVKEFRTKHGEPDIISVRKTFKTKELARKWEHKVLVKMKVTKNEKFLNKSLGSQKHSVGVKKVKQSAPILWRTYYCPGLGLLYSSKTPLYDNSVQMSINCFRENPGLKFKTIPKEYRIRINDGVRTISYDERLPLPPNFKKGYLFSNKQHQQCLTRVSFIKRTEKFRFKKVESGEIFNFSLNEFNKFSNISYSEIRFLTDGDKKIIKGWSIFDEEFKIWRNEIPRKKGNWRTIMRESANLFSEALV